MYDLSHVFGHQPVLRALLGETAPLYANAGTEPHVIL